MDTVKLMDKKVEKSRQCKLVNFTHLIGWNQDRDRTRKDKSQDIQVSMWHSTSQPYPCINTREANSSCMKPPVWPFVESWVCSFGGKTYRELGRRITSNQQKS